MAAFAGFMLLVLLMAYRAYWLHMDDQHAARLNALHKPQPKPLEAPYPAFDETAFWLYPDWDAAGDQAFWMVPQKKPLEAMSEYERGLMAGKKLWDGIEAMPVDSAAKAQMRYQLALQLAGNSSQQQLGLLSGGMSDAVRAYQSGGYLNLSSSLNRHSRH